MENSNKKDRHDKFSELSLEYSKKYGGKIQTLPKVPIRDLNDFSIWYTPGVAKVSLEIANDPDLSYEYTYRWNSIAILTDGTRVLGLGFVGPYAAMPVMEGKSLLFKYLGGVDAVPLPINVQNEYEFLRVGKAIEPSFGGINLEDIESPKCFRILEKLSESVQIPVWHDDQLGTAGAILAGLINALKYTGRNVKNTRIVFLGAGAANIAAVRILTKYGFDPGNMIVVDSKGILEPERYDIDNMMKTNPWKYDIALKTNRDRIKGNIEKALENADVLIAASTPGPGVVKGEWIKKMNKDSIIFALANPIPEIWPDEALENGSAIVATGRSDFPNQINNSMVFPGVFRGALDARVRKITDNMVIAASEELAKFAQERGLKRDYIIPKMTDWDVFPRVAAAVAKKAVEENMARKTGSYEFFYERAKEIISKTRNLIDKMINMGYIEDIRR
ncbi:MAG: NAD(P)-dependent malic enzyme [Thermoplasmata archaeon]